MGRLCMRLEGISGDDIEDVLKEAKFKAAKFDLAYVMINFNGVEFSVSRGASVDAMIKEWRENKPRKLSIIG